MLQNIGAPLLVSDLAQADEGKIFNVFGAYILLCKILKCCHYPPYALVKPHQQHFIVQAIISVVKDEVDGFLVAGDHDTTETAII